MQITNDNQETVLKQLQREGSVSLETDLKLTLEINQENYGDNEVYNLENGYGFQIYIIDDLQELIRIMKSNHANFSRVEVEEYLHDEGTISFYLKLIFLTSSESGIVVYLKGF